MKKVLFSILIACVFANSACASVTWSGNVVPTNPYTWNSSTRSYIGFQGYGTMSIGGGSDVIDESGVIGPHSTSTGIVTVIGTGSTWTHSRYLDVGFQGQGTLDIKGGGVVSDTYGTVGNQPGSTGMASVDGAGSAWINSNFLSVGLAGKATLNITRGGAVSSLYGYVGGDSMSASVKVDGEGSRWIMSNSFTVGSSGIGAVNITNGGVVSNLDSYISIYPGHTGVVTVDGSGSTWRNDGFVKVGFSGNNGTLNITAGGLVTVGDKLFIGDLGFEKDGVVNMDTGGMLALFGEADGSIDEFMGLVEGTGTIRYWDRSIGDWADIMGAAYGADYTLEYITEGDLAGYTMLTVPEPAAICLLGLGMILAQRRRV